MENNNCINIKIYELDISIRACNILRRNGYETVGDIIKFESSNDILKLPSFSIGCGKEVAKELKKIGLTNNIWYEFLEKTT